MASERTLLVVRHSKSAYPPGVADVDRPLSPRGQRDAAAAGCWLRDQGLAPDLVLCSIARRTRQTWELASDQLASADGEAGTVYYDARLYEAGPGDLAAVVTETPADVSVLALVGHNPGSAQLATALAAQAGLDFPTSAIAVISFRGGWAQVAPGSGTLAGYWTPKGGTAVLGG
jgi:phosphohistidine phosphatase